jgi:hypothetical protein
MSIPKKKKHLDKQLPLFDVIKALQEVRTAPDGGSLNIQARIQSAASAALKQTQLSRFEVAGRMSELTGVEITKWMLDSWTAESKEYHRFPAEFIPAFCIATQNWGLLAVLSECAGGYFLEGHEVLLTELGRVQDERENLRRRERQIRDYLRRLRLPDAGGEQ